MDSPKDTSKIEQEPENEVIKQSENHQELEKIPEKNKEEKKNITYLDLFCCKINVGLVFTYIYIYLPVLY